MTSCNGSFSSFISGTFSCVISHSVLLFCCYCCLLPPHPLLPHPPPLFLNFLYLFSASPPSPCSSPSSLLLLHWTSPPMVDLTCGPVRICWIISHIFSCFLLRDIAIRLPFVPSSGSLVQTIIVIDGEHFSLSLFRTQCFYHCKFRQQKTLQTYFSKVSHKRQSLAVPFELNDIKEQQVPAWQPCL